SRLVDLMANSGRMAGLANGIAVRSGAPQRPRAPGGGAPVDPRRRLGPLVRGILLADAPLLPAPPDPERLRPVRGGPRDPHRRRRGDDRRRRPPLRLDERPAR